MGKDSREFTGEELANGFDSIAHDIDDLRVEMIVLSNSYQALKPHQSYLIRIDDDLDKVIRKIRKVEKALR